MVRSTQFASDMEKKMYNQKQVLYKERKERARMMAMFFDVLCNHENEGLKRN